MNYSSKAIFFLFSLLSLELYSGNSDRFQFSSILLDAKGKPLSGSIDLNVQLGNFADSANEEVYFEKIFRKFHLSSKANGYLNVEIDLNQNGLSGGLSKEQILAKQNLQIRLILQKENTPEIKLPAQTLMPIFFAHKAYLADKVVPISSTDIQNGSIQSQHLAAGLFRDQLNQLACSDGQVILFQNNTATCAAHSPDTNIIATRAYADQISTNLGSNISSLSTNVNAALNSANSALATAIAASNRVDQLASATISATQIGAGIISDSHIAATAAIAGSKINPNFGSNALSAGSLGASSLQVSTASAAKLGVNTSISSSSTYVLDVNGSAYLSNVVASSANLATLTASAVTASTSISAPAISANTLTVATHIISGSTDSLTSTALTVHGILAATSAQITNLSASNLSVSGSISGTSANALALQGVSVSTSTPSSGQVLKYNGSAWAPSSDIDSGITALSISSAANTGASSTVAATATVSGTSASITLMQAAANQSGFLNKDDWSTFNGKQALIGTTSDISLRTLTATSIFTSGIATASRIGINTGTHTDYELNINGSALVNTVAAVNISANTITSSSLNLTGVLSIGSLSFTSTAINMGNNKIINLATPSASNDAANKTYVDTAISTAVAASIANYLPLAGGTLSGALNMGNQVISNLGSPSNTSDAATKAYVDNKWKSASISTDYTVSATDYALGIDASSGTVSISLPSASANPGKEFVLRKSDTSTELVFIDPGAGSIDGISAKRVLISQGESLDVKSNGFEWKVLDEAKTGSVMAFTGTSIPKGWKLCNGEAVSRNTFAHLFAVMGTAHGEGDGSTTFNLPDYRGRFLRGLDHAAGNDPDVGSRSSMNTGGNTGDNIGSLQVDGNLSHAHGGVTTTNGSHTHNLAYDAFKTGYWSYWSVHGMSNVYGDYGLVYAMTTDAAGDHAHGISAEGGSESRPKNAAVNFIIKY